MVALLVFCIVILIGAGGGFGDFTKQVHCRLTLASRYLIDFFPVATCRTTWMLAD